MSFDLHLGDCLESLRQLPDASVDSIVTDPPYGLSFMGKRWDYDVPGVDVWAECLRVLKPGGHLLAFAGTRTQHRMAVRIEDAGFEIRDMIAWVYGSGFPKSLDVSKAIDKRGGASVAWFGPWFRKWREDNGIAQKQVAALFPSKSGGLTGCVANWELGLNMPTAEQFNLIRDTFDLPFDSVEEAEREVVGQQRGTMLAVAPGQDNDRSATTLDITAPATDASRQWHGWGTALKPALEPITVARKPLVGTVAENVLAHGTGALNIDGCRVAGEVPRTVQGQSARAGEVYGADQRDQRVFEPHAAGRWPANLIHDGSDEVLAVFPGEDAGSAARFFYEAKCSKKDRNSGLDGFYLVIIEPVATAKGEKWASEDHQVRLLVDTAASPPRVTAAFGAQCRSVSEWNTLLFGSEHTAWSLKASMSTTGTATRSTTGLTILSYFQRLLTSASIQAANCEKTDGGSRAESAANGTTSITTTSEAMASVLGAELAACATLWKTSASAWVSNHPTVKPTDLMRYLCRLVTPPGGVVLDPFMGSGSTGKAAMLEGFRFIGCELSPEYVAIANARVAAAFEQMLGDLA